MIQGDTPEAMGNACKQHVMEMMQSGDELHTQAVQKWMLLSREEHEKWFDDFKKRFDAMQDV